MKITEFFKKKWWIILAAVAVLAGIITAVILLRTPRELSVAFYGIDKKISGPLSSEIERAWDKGVKFTEIDADGKFTADDARKFDVVITWSGKTARALAQDAAEVPGNIFNSMPTSVQKAGSDGGRMVFLPLLYDYYPLFYSKASLNHGIDEPETLESLELAASMALESGEYGFGLYAAGSRIDHFYGLLSNISESILGAEGYRKLCSLISDSQELESYIDEKLGGEPGREVTFRTVLDYIRKIQQSSCLSGQWHAYSTGDLVLLMSEDEIYSFSMPMQYYRTIPMRTAYNYRPVRFPTAQDSGEHSLVAPALVMFTGKKADKKNVLAKHMLSVSAQERLSDSTMLIPSSSQAGCYDIYADDGRFYAASSFGGIVSTIDMEAFDNAQEAQDFKTRIVQYLTTGR